MTSIEGFREKLIAAFPPRPFYSRVSTHNECDDGIALLKELPGKRWDEIQPAFLDFNSGSLPLLEARALVWRSSPLGFCDQWKRSLMKACLRS